jgi:cation diffusion facilitator family transporter
MAVKAGAYVLTGSVGLLSDALESSVNLVAAVVALLAVRWAAAPPDEAHPFGHEKAEYFASGLEGAMILVAALAIVVAAVGRLIVPRPLQALDVGVALSIGAAIVNLVVARVLVRAGRQHRSIALLADGEHLMTDVWTSAGVVVGIGAVAVTGWTILDPLLALAVALNIVRVGTRLLHRSGMGLLDTAIPADERRIIEDILDRHTAEPGLRWHALRTREAGARRFVSVHVLVPGAWTVQRGHDLCERIECALAATAPKTTVITHLEPVEDEVSFADQGLDR